MATPVTSGRRVETEGSERQFLFRGAGSDPQSRQVNIIHEIGSRLEDSTTLRAVYVPPSEAPTVIHVKSQVVASAARGINSPAYIATVRRRVTRSLAEKVGSLQKYAVREDVATGTCPVLEQLNTLLKTLAHADKEGNTREILRQIRTTIMNGGWNHYRAPDVRNLVKSLLEHLASIEDVSAKDAHLAFEKLNGVGLDSIGAPLFETCDGDESDDHEGEEVPR